MKSAITLEKLLDYFYYCEVVDPDITDYPVYPCIKYKEFKIDADECGIFETDSMVVVAVSGSDKDLEEWAGNLDAYYGPIQRFINFVKKIKVKSIKGFHYNYSVIASKLIVKVVDYLKNVSPDKPVVWVGVSRGGAISGLANQVFTEYESRKNPTLSIVYDPPKWQRLSAKRRFQKSKRSDEYVCHLVQCGQGSVTVIPPKTLFWVHNYTSRTILPKLKGKMDHTHIKDAIFSDGARLLGFLE